MALTASGSVSAGASAAARGAAISARHLRTARETPYADAFSQIVAVLIRDASFRRLRIAELEWLVVPAVLTGQWKLAHMRPQQVDQATGKARQSDMTIPVAVALWASVSAEVDRRLTEEVDKPAVLRSDEWKSGDKLWLIAVAGDKRSFPRFLRTLEETEFKGREVKVRMRGPDKKVTVTSLAVYAQSGA